MHVYVGFKFGRYRLVLGVMYQRYELSPDDISEVGSCVGSVHPALESMTLCGRYVKAMNNERKRKKGKNKKIKKIKKMKEKEKKKGEKLRRQRSRTYDLLRTPQTCKQILK
jgi:hypothetical protein